jgi:hypothetical protein
MRGAHASHAATRLTRIRHDHYMASVRLVQPLAPDQARHEAASLPGHRLSGDPSERCSNQAMSRVMRTNTKYSFLSEVLSTMGNALATAAALHRGGEPTAKNLRALGIDPAEFRKIKRYY